MTSLTAGCASLVANNGCEWARLILVEPDDRLTRQTKEKIVAHNMAWLEFCDDGRSN